MGSPVEPGGDAVPAAGSGPVVPGTDGGSGSAPDGTGGGSGYAPSAPTAWERPDADPPARPTRSFDAARARERRTALKVALTNLRKRKKARDQ